MEKKRSSQIPVYTVCHTSTRSTSYDGGSHRTVGCELDTSLTCQPMLSAEGYNDSSCPFQVWCEDIWGKSQGKWPRVCKGYSLSPGPGTHHQAWLREIHKPHELTSSLPTMEGTEDRGLSWSSIVRNKTLKVWSIREGLEAKTTLKRREYPICA